MPTFDLEYELIDKGYVNVFGIDESARGNLAGSVYAAAVRLDLALIESFGKFVDDSKKISMKKREEIADIIKVTCQWSIGTASNVEIDEINILEATKLAMQRAVAQHKDVDYLLIDGNMSFRGIFGDVPYQSIIKGDATCLSIAAASILAKTEQCQAMLEFDKLYPQYGFASNRGYGTKKHREAIVKHGVTPIHRKTFKRVREFV